MTGSVEHGKYETSIGMDKIGVISGRDITTESALTKMMYLLGEDYTADKVKSLLSKSLRGELSN